MLMGFRNWHYTLLMYSIGEIDNYSSNERLSEGQALIVSLDSMIKLICNWHYILFHYTTEVALCWNVVEIYHVGLKLLKEL